MNGAMRGENRNKVKLPYFRAVEGNVPVGTFASSSFTYKTFSFITNYRQL